MTERERLIKLIYEALLDMSGKHIGDPTARCESIADYPLERGVIVPPCKVGDAVYSLSGEGIFRQIVELMEIDKYSQIRLRCECDLDCNKCPHMGCWNEYRYRVYGLDDIGTSVFLTREEAEAALAERRKA